LFFFGEAKKIDNLSYIPTPRPKSRKSPSAAEISPRSAINVPDIRLIHNSCRSRNFLLKILILVLRINHHKAVPRKIP